MNRIINKLKKIAFDYDYIIVNIKGNETKVKNPIEINNILKQQDIIINKGKAIICDLLYRKYSDKDISLYGLSFESYKSFYSNYEEWFMAFRN